MSAPLQASNAYTSSLSINRLTLSVHLGVEAQERAHPQAVELTLTFYFPAPTPGSQHDRGDYLCYDNISSKIKAMCEGREFRLIEYLGTEIYRTVRGALAEKCTDKAAAQDIKIGLGITKCNLPIPFVLGGASYRYSDLPPFSWIPPC